MGALGMPSPQMNLRRGDQFKPITLGEILAVNNGGY